MAGCSGTVASTQHALKDGRGGLEAVRAGTVSVQWFQGMFG